MVGWNLVRGDFAVAIIIIIIIAQEGSRSSQLECFNLVLELSVDFAVQRLERDMAGRACLVALGQPLLEAVLGDGMLAFCSDGDGTVQKDVRYGANVVGWNAIAFIVGTLTVIGKR